MTRSQRSLYDEILMEQRPGLPGADNPDEPGRVFEAGRDQSSTTARAMRDRDPWRSRTK